MKAPFASSQPDLALLARLERLRDLLLLGTLAFAALILLAWWLPPLAAALPDGWWGMKAWTALWVLALASAFHLVRPGRPRRQQIVAWVLTALVAASAVWLLAERLGWATFSISQWPAHDPYSGRAGRPSLQTLLLMLLITACLPFLGLRKSLAARAVDLGVALILWLWLVFVAGYVFGSALPTADGLATRVSLQTLLSFSPLVLAVAIGRLETGFYSVLIGIGIGSHIARLTLPVAMLLPFLLDFSGGVALMQGWFSLPYVVAFSSALLAHAFIFLILGMAWRINGLEQELRAQSLTDALTGLANRRGFDLLGEQIWLEARRAVGVVTVLFFDLDGLKSVNDQQGHAEGSRLIADTARLLRDTFRASDVVARVGGDEFAVVTRGDPVLLDAALARLERARQEVNRQHPERQVRYSVGQASHTPTTDTGFDALVARADAAMYQVKKRRKAMRE